MNGATAVKHWTRSAVRYDNEYVTVGGAGTCVSALLVWAVDGSIVAKGMDCPRPTPPFRMAPIRRPLDAGGAERATAADSRFTPGGSLRLWEEVPASLPRPSMQWGKS